MRTAIKTTEVFTFDELPRDIQNKAIEKLYYINVDYEWWDSIYDDAAEISMKITGFDLGRNYDLTANISDCVETAHGIIDNHGAVCDTYKLAETFLKERDELIDTWGRDEDGELEDERELDFKLEDLEEDFRKSLCEEYIIILSKEYDYLTSREAIEETIEANNYEFTAKGYLYQ